MPPSAFLIGAKRSLVPPMMLLFAVVFFRAAIPAGTSTVARESAVFFVVGAKRPLNCREKAAERPLARNLFWPRSST